MPAAAAGAEEPARASTSRSSRRSPPTPTAPSSRRRARRRPANPSARSLGEGSDLLGDVPADAWLALGQPDLGKTHRRAARPASAQRSAAGTQIEQQLRAATGLNLDEAVGWMGDFSIFVRGESRPGARRRARRRDRRRGELGQDAAGRAAPRAHRRRRHAGAAAGHPRRRLPADQPGGAAAGLRLPARRPGRDRLRRGGGQGRARRSRQKLVDSSEFKAASDSLGEGYSVSTYLAIAPILKLVESTPAGRRQPSGRRQALPRAARRDRVAAPRRTATRCPRRCGSRCRSGDGSGAAQKPCCQATTAAPPPRSRRARRRRCSSRARRAASAAGRSRSWRRRRGRLRVVGGGVGVRRLTASPPRRRGCW